LKLVSFLKNGNECAGLISGDEVYELNMLQSGLPDSIKGVLAGWDEYFPLLLKLSKELDRSAKIKSRGLALKEIHLRKTRNQKQLNSSLKSLVIHTLLQTLRPSSVKYGIISIVYVFSKLIK